jgi:YHS domain-containing protein
MQCKECQMRLLFITLLLSAAFGAVVLAAKDQQPASQPATAPSTQPAGKPVNKFCAVEKDNEVDPKIATVVYKGKTIGFCCSDCIKEFQKDPEKYVTSLK